MNTTRLSARPKWVVRRLVSTSSAVRWKPLIASSSASSLLQKMRARGFPFNPAMARSRSVPYTSIDSPAMISAPEATEPIISFAAKVGIHVRSENRRGNPYAVYPQVNIDTSGRFVGLVPTAVYSSLRAFSPT